jgi:hypothetical protein
MMHPETPKVITDHPLFLYTSRPTEWSVRYVFVDKVCLGFEEALAYVEDYWRAKSQEDR